MNRREFSKAAALAATALAPLGNAMAQGATGTLPQPSTGTLRLQEGQRLQVGMIIFDGMTNQDFVGPNDIFSRVPDMDIDVLAKTDGPIRTDARGRILPDKALRDAKPHYDLLFIGGGGGTTPLMEDAEVLDFLREKARTAHYITSVCTGALVLGAAGLLDGYRAATHWAAMDVLPLLGAIPTKQRVVIDRNRITGGGITAGIDFGLTVISELWGAELAQVIQLGMEYDPHPPFNSGSPDTANPQVLAIARQKVQRMTNARIEAATRIAAARKA